jgi:hypothetical protein
MKEIIYTYEIKTIFPFRNLEECYNNGLVDLIAEMETLNAKINLPIQHFGEVPMSFQFLKNVESDDFESNYNNNDSEKKLFLIIDTSVNINLKEIIEKTQIKSSDTSDLPPEVIVLAYYKLIHKTYLTHFLRFTQIAYPGSLWLDNAVVYSKESLIDRVDGLSSVLSEYDFKESKWPDFDAPSIKDVWSYIVDYTNILNEFSCTEIERALNSYTYLFSKNYHNDIPISLFWSLSGLESLYVTGEVGITQQLNDKIQAFLGDITENKKILKKLYNYRSGLIHGDLHIPINDGVMNNEKHFDDLYSMNSLSAIILVATLQKLIKNGMKKLEFKYVYK